jgi:2-C-methyl-D-erythritol 4-phosphate cytidylyltransferase
MNIVVVINEEYIQFWTDLAATFTLKIPHRVVAGGDERFYSVKKGLDAIGEKNGIVGIHDAVRPLVSLKTIESCFTLACTKGNAIPVVEINDTVRNLKGEWIDRTQLRIVQTPQCFELSTLRVAYQQAYRSSFTDDASVLQEMGEHLNFVEGNRENFKITTAEDLRIAETLSI